MFEEQFNYKYLDLLRFIDYYEFVMSSLFREGCY